MLLIEYSIILFYSKIPKLYDNSYRRLIYCFYQPNAALLRTADLRTVFSKTKA